MCVFFSRICIKAWITAPLVKALNCDLSLLKSLKEYAEINDAISEMTTKNMARLLCYLSEELIGLSLFDHVMPSIKKQMAQAILQPIERGVPAKKASVSLDSITSITS